ncbi:hypothetical protein FRB94_004019 [Tulasnella sp. JGI-2019a]|nr:hypothetical protein FRB93_003352 [Tulasnella sp. JGI-2019a]KAG9002277.1 hypothetical protein FRB94_004019 [Tulasnella sp. JGI-2019a]KAG9032840.1 hypothetical protein FRB95_000924 [Tulasnella sp. JGI-2019a]
MAKALGKKTASENEKALDSLLYGMIISSFLYVILRVAWRTFPPTVFQAAIYSITLAPTIYLYFYLKSIGTPKRDSTGKVISAGEDLNQAGGLMEVFWDIIYVTWACQIGSSLFGDWFWWMYSSIPLYGVFKGYTLVFGSPFASGSASSAESSGGATEGLASGAAGAAGAEKPKDGLSNRQAKLQKRQEKFEASQKKQAAGGRPVRS